MKGTQTCKSVRPAEFYSAQIGKQRRKSPLAAQGPALCSVTECGYSSKGGSAAPPGDAENKGGFVAIF
jgi:hypothetical protein